MIEYKPYDKRVPDGQYLELVEKVLRHGRDKKPIHADQKENRGSGHSVAREMSGLTLSYDLSNGFPWLTERNLFRVGKGAVGELIGFINGAQTLEELMKYGCPEKFWEKWVTEDKCSVWGLEKGDLGPGSYGPVLRKQRVPSTNEPELTFFDQTSEVFKACQECPMSRTLATSTWCPHLALGGPGQRKVVVAPCHGTFVHFHIFPEIGELEVTHVQRSADILVGLQFNLIQWCLFGLMFAKLLNLKYTKYTHFISSAQIYDIQFDSAERMLRVTPNAFPTVTLIDTESKPIQKPWDFRIENVALGDYQPNPYFNIRTPI